MRTIFTSLTALAVATAFAGLAQAATFGEIDTDGNGEISQTEFAEAFPTATEQDWLAADVDANGGISEDEYKVAEEAGLLPAG